MTSPTTKPVYSPDHILSHREGELRRLEPFFDDQGFFRLLTMRSNIPVLEGNSDVIVRLVPLTDEQAGKFIGPEFDAWMERLSQVSSDPEMADLCEHNGVLSHYSDEIDRVEVATFASRMVEADDVDVEFSEGINGYAQSSVYATVARLAEISSLRASFIEHLERHIGDVVSGHIDPASFLYWTVSKPRSEGRAQNKLQQLPGLCPKVIDLEDAENLTDTTLRRSGCSNFLAIPMSD